MQYVKKLKLAIASILLSTPILSAEGRPKCPSVSHPIYCSILKLNQNIDKSYAFKLSNYIHKATKKYKLDPMRSVAIAAQESMFQNIHRKHTVLELVEKCENDTCVEYMRTVRGYTDIGVWQFHAATIRQYGMDALRLRDDIEYATDRHAFLLRAKLRECADLGTDAWVCYHSRTVKYREKYKRMVNRYYNRIKDK